MSRSDPEVSVTTVDENGGVTPLDVAVDRMNDKRSVLSPAGGGPSCWNIWFTSHAVQVLAYLTIQLFSNSGPSINLRRSGNYSYRDRQDEIRQRISSLFL